MALSRRPIGPCGSISHIRIRPIREGWDTSLVSEPKTTSVPAHPLPVNMFATRLAMKTSRQLREKTGTCWTRTSKSTFTNARRAATWWTCASLRRCFFTRTTSRGRISTTAVRSEFFRTEPAVPPLSLSRCFERVTFSASETPFRLQFYPLVLAARNIVLLSMLLAI